MVIAGVGEDRIDHRLCVLAAEVPATPGAGHRSHRPRLPKALRECRVRCRGVVPVPATRSRLLMQVPVLVDEAVASAGSNGSDAGSQGWSVVRGGCCGRALAQGPVRAVVDVVDDDSLELSTVLDEGAIEELATQPADPALGERVRDGASHGRLHHADVLAAEHLVERSDELASPITHQSPASDEAVAVAQEQACSLGCPLSGRVLRDAAVKMRRVGMSMENRR